MKKYIKPATTYICVELQKIITDSFQKFSEDVSDPRAKGYDFYADSETTEGTGYPVYNPWED